MVKITHDFEKKLDEHIKSIEANSPIEIVPVIYKKASDYTSWSIIIGLIISYIPAQILSHSIPLWTSAVLLVDGLLWLLMALAMAWLLRKFHLYALMAPRALLHEKALHAAENAFLKEGIFETKRRLGILIAVFEAEKTVIVLADRGFNGIIAHDYWAKLGGTLAQDFNRKKAGDEFFEALHEIEKNVAGKFQHEDENPNELTDSLRKK